MCNALTTKVEVKPSKSAVWQKEKSLPSIQNRVAFNVGLLLSKTLITQKNIIRFHNLLFILLNTKNNGDMHDNMIMIYDMISPSLTFDLLLR